jgi:hypothetical protein
MDTPRDFSSPPSAIYASYITPLAAEWSEIQVQFVGTHRDLERTPAVFVPPLLLFVLSPSHFDLWLDVDASPHFAPALPPVFHAG